MHKILQNHLLRTFVANLKINAMYALYLESFCDKNLAIRKVFAFCDSVHWYSFRLWKPIKFGFLWNMKIANYKCAKIASDPDEIALYLIFSEANINFWFCQIQTWIFHLNWSEHKYCHCFWTESCELGKMPKTLIVMFEKDLVKSNLSHIGSIHNAVSKDTRIKRARKTDK